MRSTRDKLLMSLSELQQFVMILIQSAHAQTANNPVMQVPNTNQITAQIIEKQKLVNDIIKVRTNIIICFANQSIIVNPAIHKIAKYWRFSVGV